MQIVRCSDRLQGFLYQGRCYEFANNGTFERLNYTEATERCKVNGRKLIGIESDDMITSLIHFIRNYLWDPGVPMVRLWTSSTYDVSTLYNIGLKIMILTHHGQTIWQS